MRTLTVFFPYFQEDFHRTFLKAFVPNGGQFFFPDVMFCRRLSIVVAFITLILVLIIIIVIIIVTRIPL